MNEIPPKIKQQVPPIMATPAAPPRVIYVVQQAVQQKSTLSQLGDVIRWLFILFFVGVFVILGIGVWYVSEHPNPSSQVAQTARARVSPMDEARPFVKIEERSWRRSTGGSLMEATFTIKNGSKSDIKDVKIKCTHTANSGTVIDSNTRTIYEVIRAGQSRTFENFDMGFIHSQAVHSSAEVQNFAIVEK